MRPVAETTRSRREEILQGAKHLFAERGFRETNLNDVAARLGVRRQAIYHYFESKDEILFELIEGAGHALARAAQPVLDSDRPPLDKLREIVKVHVRHVLTDADVFRIQINELNKLSGDRGATVRRHHSAYYHRVAEVIAEGQRDGLLVDIPAVAQALVIIGMCQWVVFWYSPDAKLSIEEMADYIAELAINGARRQGGGS